MTNRYKIIILACIALLFCNFMVKVTVMDKQAREISVLQGDIFTIRRGALTP